MNRRGQTPSQILLFLSGIVFLYFFILPQLPSSEQDQCIKEELSFLYKSPNEQVMNFREYAIESEAEILFIPEGIPFNITLNSTTTKISKGDYRNISGIRVESNYQNLDQLFLYNPGNTEIINITFSYCREKTEKEILKEKLDGYDCDEMLMDIYGSNDLYSNASDLQLQFYYTLKGCIEQ